MNSDSFTKLFGTIITSSIWSEDDKTRIMWITLLACADSDGYCSGSIVGFAAMARMSLKDAEAAVARLEAPDEHSRTPDHEGKRIIKVDGGWLLVNYAKYREMAKKEERREYLRRKQQEKRHPCQQLSTSVNKVSTIPSASASASSEDRGCGGKEPEPADAEWPIVRDCVGLDFPVLEYCILRASYPNANFKMCIAEVTRAWTVGDMDRQHFRNKLKKLLSESDLKRSRMFELKMKVGEND